MTAKKLQEAANDLDENVAAVVSAAEELKDALTAFRKAAAAHEEAHSEPVTRAVRVLPAHIARLEDFAVGLLENAPVNSDLTDAVTGIIKDRYGRIAASRVEAILKEYK